MVNDNIIVVNNIITERSSEVITISGDSSSSKNIMDNFVYKISADGTVIRLNPLTESKSSVESSLHTNSNLTDRQKLENKLINASFEYIPVEIEDKELENIYEYAKVNVIKEKGIGRIYPYSVKMLSEGDLNIILLMVNGNKEFLTLTKFPFKLTDTSGVVIISDLVDINKTISPNKIGICNLLINKSNLIQEKIDLTSWTVAFEIS